MDLKEFTNVSGEGVSPTVKYVLAFIAVILLAVGGYVMVEGNPLAGEATVSEEPKGSNIELNISNENKQKTENNIDSGDDY